MYQVLPIVGCAVALVCKPLTWIKPVFVEVAKMTADDLTRI